MGTLTPFLERIRSGCPLVCDGGLGTMLVRAGLMSGECPEALNLSKPDVLTRIARDYVDAGAEIATTNTFGGSPRKLARYGLEAQHAEINAAGVRIVRDAVGDRAYVAASYGPTGAMLRPLGDADPDHVFAGYREQVAAFAQAGADVLFVETMTDLKEATLAVRAAREAAPALPVAATMTFDRTKRGYFTMMGVSVPKAADGLRAAGADVLGSNCGNGIENMIEVAREFRAATDLPLLIQANAGLPRIENGQTVYPETPEFMAEKVVELLNLGVAIVGGCCGTTPEHIRAFRRVVDDFASERT